MSSSKRSEGEILEKKGQKYLLFTLKIEEKKFSGENCCEKL